MSKSAVWRYFEANRGQEEESAAAESDSESSQMSRSEDEDLINEDNEDDANSGFSGLDVDTSEEEDT